MLLDGYYFISWRLFQSVRRNRGRKHLKVVQQKIQDKIFSKSQFKKYYMHYYMLYSVIKACRLLLKYFIGTPCQEAWTSLNTPHDWQQEVNFAQRNAFCDWLKFFWIYNKWRDWRSPLCGDTNHFHIVYRLVHLEKSPVSSPRKIPTGSEQDDLWN